jgi:hypothetical protein
MRKIVHGAPAIASDCHLPTAELKDVDRLGKCIFQPLFLAPQFLRRFSVDLFQTSRSRYGNVIASHAEIRQFSRDTSADG